MPQSDRSLSHDSGALVISLRFLGCYSTVKYGLQGDFSTIAHPSLSSNCSESLSEGTSAPRSPPGSGLSWLPCLANTKSRFLRVEGFRVSGCLTKRRTFHRPRVVHFQDRNSVNSMTTAVLCSLACAMSRKREASLLPCSEGKHISTSRCTRRHERIVQAFVCSCVGLVSDHARKQLSAQCCMAGSGKPSFGTSLVESVVEICKPFDFVVPSLL